MLWTTRSRAPDRATVGAGALILILVAAAAGSCAVIAGHAANRPLRSVTRSHGRRTAVLAGSPGVVAARAAGALFARAPLVVLAGTGRKAAIAIAAAQARKLHAPLLLVPVFRVNWRAGGRSRRASTSAGCRHCRRGLSCQVRRRAGRRPHCENAVGQDRAPRRSTHARRAGSARRRSRDQPCLGPATWRRGHHRRSSGGRDPGAGPAEARCRSGQAATI